ncbi:MAG: restriction endonuclease subunit S [Pirellulaceae bacterium]|nr:restriction endonuclease subunit S [Pirellulaceae bacterium]
MASKVKATTTTTAPTTNGNLPKGWRMVRFDELAQMVNERVDPSNTDAEIYVGLEHLDPDSLKLRRWGTPSDVIGDKLQFRKGDIIFGRRRAYQRKLAVAEFDGICSAHAMVVRARNETVDPEFLPFLMQSDLFMQRAIDISVGSLSPTINWTTLRIQEFPLPPKDEQRRIADILWAADEVGESTKQCIEAASLARGRFVSEYLEELSCEPVALSELWTESPGSGYSPVPAPDDTGHYVLVLSALSAKGYIRGNLKPVKIDERVQSTIVKQGDLLVSRSNTVDLVGLVGVFDEDRNDVSFPDLMMRVRVDEARINTRFLEAVMLATLGRRHMQRVAAGTSGSMKKINRVGLGSFMVPLPSLDEQICFVKQITAFDAVLNNLSHKLIAEQQLKKLLFSHLVQAEEEQSHVH